MPSEIEQLALLLLIAAVVSLITRRLHLPYSVGLVFAGACLAVLPFRLALHLTRDLIFSVFLPPLIFETALQMRWKELRHDLLVTGTLATVGVVLSAGVIAVGIHYFIGWDWATAILLAVLISATDPVSVIATFKESGITGRLRMLVEAESLFNDGTVAVLFAVALSATQGGTIAVPALTLTFFTTILGGIFTGAIVGGAVLILVGRTCDPLVEITFTTIAAYVSFLTAEHFHLSGVLATLTAGVLVGNIGALGVMTEAGREAVESFWAFAGFVANSLIFLLIGVRLTNQPFGEVWLPALLVILLILVGRAVAVYPCCALFARSRWRITLSHQHILFWGGLRGALALALVFGLPPDTPHRPALLTITFAVVAFSIIVQGLTMPPLLRVLGERDNRQ